MRKILEILTPENVYVEYELAGLGSRFAAMLIDSIIQGVGIALFSLIIYIGGFDFQTMRAKNPAIVAAALIITFLITFGYFIFFEMIMKGQTPGKKIMNLKAVKYTGEPIGFYDSFIRNILRLADMLPALYLAGAAFLLFTKNYRRIGDFAANTMVIKVKKVEKPMTIDALLEQASRAESLGQPLNIYPVSNFEYNVLKEFLARKDSLGERKPVFAFHLNRYFMKKFNIEKPYTDPYAFFQEIVNMNSGL